MRLASVQGAGPLAAAFVLALATHATSVAQASRPAKPAPAKETVRSKDGTTIAYEKSGKGPVIVIVAGALTDRAGGRGLAAVLAPAFTAVNYDRRGRGDSLDRPPYAVEREIEDVEAVIDGSGGPAFLFGSSSGAVLALEAANKLGPKVRASVLFEPPFIVDDSRPPIPDGFFDEIGKLVAGGRRGDALALCMEKGIGVPAEMVAQMRRAPMWPGMEKLAHTLPYDGALLKGLQSGKPLPAGRWSALKTPALVVDGGLSDPFLRNSAQALTGILPTAGRRTLEGQDHSAAFTAPQSLVPLITEFFAPLKAGNEGGKKGTESR